MFRCCMKILIEKIYTSGVINWRQTSLKERERETNTTVNQMHLKLVPDVAFEETIMKLSLVIESG